MKRFVLILAAVLGLALVVSVVAVPPATATEIPPPGQDAKDPDFFHDSEGNRYFCIDKDPEHGCLYRVDQTDTEFILYWVGNDGFRRNYRVPKSGWGTSDGTYQWSVSENDGYWQFTWFKHWRFLGDYDLADPNAWVGPLYPCCDEYGNC